MVRGGTSHSNFLRITVCLGRETRRPRRQRERSLGWVWRVVWPVPLAEQIEFLLVELADAMVPEPRYGPGRRPILPAAVLLASLVIGVLRGTMSQLAVWRMVTARGLWRASPIVVTDQTVYNRLDVAGPSPLEGLFRYATAELQARPGRWYDGTLAPFAADVVALDETTLDPIARSLPALRTAPPGDHRLLPGKLAGVFGVRDQLWRTLQIIPEPRQNEKVAARDLMATLAPGTMVLADLGYFGFRSDRCRALLDLPLPGKDECSGTDSLSGRDHDRSIGLAGRLSR